MQNNESNTVNTEATEAGNRKLAAGVFDNGEVMDILRERIHSLPYIAKLAAVLLGDLHFLECQACYHEGISDLMQGLHEDVMNCQNRPADPQAVELLNLYRMAQPLMISDDNRRWRKFLEIWTEAVIDSSDNSVN